MPDEVEVLGETTTLREFVDGEGIDEHLQMHVTVGETIEGYRYHYNSQGSSDAPQGCSDEVAHEFSK